MVLFLEVEFEPLARRLSLFVGGLVLSFAGVYLINSLPDHDAATAAAMGLPASREELEKAFKAGLYGSDEVLPASLPSRRAGHERHGREVGARDRGFSSEGCGGRGGR